VTQASFDLIHQRRYAAYPKLLASPQLLVRHAITHSMPTNEEGERPAFKSGLRGGRKPKGGIDRLTQPPPPMLDECLASFSPILHEVLADLSLADKDEAVIAPIPTAMQPVFDKAIAQVNVRSACVRVCVSICASFWPPCTVVLLVPLFRR
jgi:hypothetical protein